MSLTSKKAKTMKWDEGLIELLKVIERLIKIHMQK